MQSSLPWQDARGYFMLPQQREEAAYYTYGSPAGGLAQYAHPAMLSFLFRLEHLWGAADPRCIGVGNISLAGGGRFPPHRSHRSGLEVDLRPMRRDGRQAPVNYRMQAYDQAATARLVGTIWATGMVRRVMFNDSSLARVQPMAGHDDHLHVEVNA